MLRVGLTGDLGSGKSTVAQMLAKRGAIILSSDEMGRAMMKPGQPVYMQIVENFGNSIVQSDGSLNRSALAHLAFDPAHPRIEELNVIVHPAVIAEQAKQIAEIQKKQSDTIVVVESALIFSTLYSPRGDWRERFDCIILVTAPDEMKIDRFIQRARPDSDRSALRQDARRRILAQQAPAPSGIPLLRIENNRSLLDLESEVDTLWGKLLSFEQKTHNL